MPFTPGQVAEMLKIPDSTIRLYAKLFAEYISPQTGRKHRLYTEQDILTFGKIKELRSRHTPMDAIGPLLQVENQDMARPKESALALVPSIAAEIEGANQQARAALARVEEVNTMLSQIAADQTDQAAQLARLQRWAALPWWKRLFTRPPID